MKKDVALDNDWLFEWAGTRENTATGATEAASGLSSLNAWFSATDGGATIHSSLSKSMAERASLAGEYFAVVDGTDIRSQLATYVGTTVWEVFGDSVNVLYSEPRKVVRTRRA